MSEILAVTVDGKWRLGLGDPSVGAYAVTSFYLLTSLGCFFQFYECRPTLAKHHLTGESRESHYWLLLAISLGFLGINKQLDLQTLLTIVGREAVVHWGVYDQRRTIQLVFILLLTTGCVGGLIITSIFVRNLGGPAFLATTGCAVQLTFVISRAASFHHIDKLLSIQLPIGKTNLVLESIGLLIIAAALIWKRNTR
jgi:hypothetical protein